VAAPVILECQVDGSGKVVDAKVLRGDEPLGEAARKAVLKRRYQPLKLDGVPTGDGGPIPRRRGGRP
jgi:TonB family protein